METKKISIIALIDNPNNLDLLQSNLNKITDYHVDFTSCQDRDHANKLILEKAPNIIFLSSFSDEKYPTLSPNRNGTPNLPFIILTNNEKDFLSSECTKTKVCDYILTDEVTPKNLQRVIQNLTTQLQLRQENATLVRQLKQAQKMALIGEMAAGVTHELNNILCGIMSYPELLLMQLPPNSSMRNYINKIRIAGKRAADVIADLLAATRCAGTKKQLYSLNSLVQQFKESTNYLQLQSSAPSIDFKFDLAPGHFPILCSPIHIIKCLNNLVCTAFDLTQKNGTIIISTSQQHFEASPLKKAEFPPGDYITLSVLSTGEAILDEDLKYIFKPYYIKKNMARSKTGLGLAIVWSIMQHHNGTIIATSNDTETIFKLCFPIPERESET